MTIYSLSTIFVLATLHTVIAPAEKQTWLLVAVNETKEDAKIGFTLEVLISEKSKKWNQASVSFVGRDFPLLKETVLRHRFYQKAFAAMRATEVGESITSIEVKSPAFFAQLEQTQVAPDRITFAIRFFEEGAELVLRLSKKLVISKRLKMLLNNPDKLDGDFLVREVPGFTIARKSNMYRNDKRLTLQKKQNDYVVTIFQNDAQQLQGRSSLSPDTRTCFQRTEGKNGREEELSVTILRR